MDSKKKKQQHLTKWQVIQIVNSIISLI
jgi:hypothetical protein